MTARYDEMAFLRDSELGAEWNDHAFPSVDFNEPDDEKRYSDAGYHTDWNSDDHKDGISYRFHWTFAFQFSKPPAPVPADFEFKALVYIINTINEAYAHGVVEFAGFVKDENMNRATVPSAVNYEELYRNRGMERFLSGAGATCDQDIPVWMEGHIKLSGDVRRGKRCAVGWARPVPVPGLAKPLAHEWKFKVELVALFPVHPDDIFIKLKPIIDDLAKRAPATLNVDARVTGHALTPVYGVPFNPAASRITEEEEKKLDDMCEELSLSSMDRFQYFSWCVDAYIEQSYLIRDRYFPTPTMPDGGIRLEMPETRLGDRPVKLLRHLSSDAQRKGKWNTARIFFDMAVETCASLVVVMQEYDLKWVNRLHADLNHICSNCDILEETLKEPDFKEQAKQDLVFIAPFKATRRKGRMNMFDEWVYYEKINKKIAKTAAEISARVLATERRHYLAGKDKE